MITEIEERMHFYVSLIYSSSQILAPFQLSTNYGNNKMFSTASSRTLYTACVIVICSIKKDGKQCSHFPNDDVRKEGEYNM